jgi:hypothetical protein
MRWANGKTDEEVLYTVSGGIQLLEEFLKGKSEWLRQVIGIKGI